jgi:aldehyde oxidoreductase
MYALFISEVSVDITTGKVNVDRMIYVGDNGTITNRGTVDGQIYGGLVQGIGLALTEDFDDLKKHVNLLDCGLPYPRDIPDDMEILYLETPRPQGPYGAAGVGEAPLTAPHPAILNAIYNAVGVRILKVPALPELVKKGLELKAAGKPAIIPARN